MPGASVERLRRWAMALPAVTETRHARFAPPIWRVGGRTFLGMEPDKTLATFCITEESAVAAAAAHPETLRVVHRSDARRSYLGLEVRLRVTSGARLQLLVREAWAARAPGKVVRKYLDEGGRLPKPLGTRYVPRVVRSEGSTMGRSWPVTSRIGRSGRAVTEPCPPFPRAVRWQIQPG